MRKLLLLFIILNQFVVFGFEIKELKIEGKRLYYYLEKSQIKESSKTLVFLHGSIANFKNLKQSRTVPLDSLLEFNPHFVSHFTEMGYDCYFPIACGEFNWLDVKGEKLIQTMLEIENKKATEVVLSGFSDGATGSFRYFYSNPERYQSLLVFNAFPQLEWFSDGIDYKKVLNKKVVFVSQDKDKTIPHEFSLLAYRRQKLVNQETYFMLREGNHEFGKYSQNDFSLLIKILESPFMAKKNTEEFTWIFPPLDALIVDNKLLEVYPFRKEIAKKYNFIVEEYMSQKESYDNLKKNLADNETVQFLPLLIPTKELSTAKMFELEYVIKLANKENFSATIFIDNYLLLDSWQE